MINTKKQNSPKTTKNQNTPKTPKKPRKAKKSASSWLRTPMAKQYEVKEYSIYQGIAYVMLSGILLGIVWGAIRWYWLKDDWLPMASSDLPKFIIPILFSFIHLYISRNWIRSIHNKVETKFWVGLFFFSFFFFSNISSFVQKRASTYAIISTINANTLDYFGKKDYIQIQHFNNSELVSAINNYSVDSYTSKKKGGENINIVYSEVYHLTHKPNVLICNKYKSVHDFTYTSEKRINKWTHDLVKESRYRFFNENKENMVFKRLRHGDNTKYYLNAVRNYTNEDELSDKDLVFYEMTGEKQFDFGRINIYIFQFMLVFEAFILLLLFNYYFVREEFEESYIISRGIKGKLSRIFAKPDYLLPAIPPLLCIFIYVFLFFVGFRSDSNNIELLIRWGALKTDLVLYGHEWWRLLTYGFLHGGFMHVFGNLFSYVLCVGFLSINYRGRAIFGIFMLSVIISGISILLFSDGITIGASGGVFGLLAFWGVVSLKKSFDMAKAPLMFLGLNLVTSLGNGVSMSGHLGGAFAGIVIALVADKWLRVSDT